MILTIELPNSLHGEFKAYCAKQETSMKEKIEHLINKELSGSRFKIFVGDFELG